MNALMETACRFYEAHLTDDHRAFLQERYGLIPAFVEAMRIGYAPPDGTALLLHLMDRGHSTDDILRSGLVSRWEKKDRTGITDHLRGRIVFPYLSEQLAPLYMIGRATDETPADRSGSVPKYKKQIVKPDGPQEPIFGAWSVYSGDPLIITEGVTDALAVLQDSRPCISPVTTSFKEEKVAEVVTLCKGVAWVCIVNDNEESGAGTQGAAKTALTLLKNGIAEVYIATLPRPEGVEKIDACDFLRGGGDLEGVLADAIHADVHPAIREERRKETQAAVTAYRAEIARQRRIRNGTNNDDKIEELKNRMPSLSAYTGIAPGKRGAHPVYGSTHGDNFAVSEDGETWTSFHGGEEKGKGGNIFKLIALEQGFLTDECRPLRGEAFKQTIRYCRERWGTPI